MAALTSLMTRFCASEDSWLARSSTSDPGTSEIRDGNGKPRANKNKRRNKEDIPDNTAVNARFRALDQVSGKSLSKAEEMDRLA